VGWFLVLRCIMYRVAVYIHRVSIFLDIAGATKGRHKKVLITTKVILLDMKGYLLPVEF